MNNPQQRKMLAIAALAEMYGKELTDAAMEMYLEAIRDLDPQRIERAARIAAKTERFMPTPVILREIGYVPPSQRRETDPERLRSKRDYRAKIARIESQNGDAK